MLGESQKWQPLGKMAKAEAVAHPALFLFWKKASLMTGFDHQLDGGSLKLRG